jgi:hypothetical protein
MRAAGIAALAVSLVAGPLHAQQRFATPDAAAAALIDAVRANDIGRLTTLFGPELPSIAGLTDRELVARKAANFLRLADEALKLEPVDEGTRIVTVGKTAWPIAIPITREGDGWRFNVAAGRNELLDRIVGENELEAIRTCRAYLQAQLHYAAADHGGDKVLRYAQRLASTRGKRDGLYWPPANQGDRSPLIEDVAVAAVDPPAPGTAAQQPRPYYGYYFRVLTRQGPAAPGGAHGYIVNGNMIAGHALIA